MMMLHRTGSKHRGGHNEGSWAVSYVDMLTLLLCFFIIFYNTSVVEKEQRSEMSTLDQIVFDLKGGGGLGKNTGTGISTGDGQGPGVGSGAGTDAGSNIQRPQGILSTSGNATLSDADFNFLELIRKNVDAKAQNTSTKIVSKTLEINFEGISFFNSASTKLNSGGKTVVRNLIDLLNAHKDKIRITVQGHTDSRVVDQTRHAISDNWELSVLRATSVLKEFITKGYSAQALSAEGFADTKTKTKTRQIASEKLAYQRRVTFKIEARVQ